ncbi:hypothetical protein EVAR_79448_1 [Eumeta japonica]|uniref:Uncharacterized protein n=1 Tax=Eumeta variegata TaxID=151549 RepID=A0A4C1UEI5_EUMVA|nr:hypothetical protein EVAR_79448_1 [Eumeta japonica]
MDLTNYVLLIGRRTSHLPFAPGVRTTNAVNEHGHITFKRFSANEPIQHRQFDPHPTQFHKSSVSPVRADGSPTASRPRIVLKYRHHGASSGRPTTAANKQTQLGRSVFLHFAANHLSVDGSAVKCVAFSSGHIEFDPDD